MLVKRKLEASALAHVKRQLTCENDKFRMALVQLPVREGELWVLAPESLPESVLNRFQNEDHPLTWDEREQETGEVERLVSQFVTADPANICILEEEAPISEADDALSWYDLGGVVGYVVTATNASAAYISEVVETVSPFSFLACLTSLPSGKGLPSPRSSVPDDLLGSLAQRSEMLILQAYENGGFIFWQRRSRGWTATSTFGDALAD